VGELARNRALTLDSDLLVLNIDHIEELATTSEGRAAARDADI